MTKELVITKAKNAGPTMTLIVRFNSNSSTPEAPELKLQQTPYFNGLIIYATLFLLGKVANLNLNKQC